MESSDANRAVRLVSRGDAGGGLTLITLDPPADLVAQYTHPGQVIKLLFPAASGYFALASNVGVSPWELCVRDSGDASLELLRASIGSEIAMRGVIGDGFPMAAANGRTLAVVVVGSAICVARPIAAVRGRENAMHATRVYAGARDEAALPFAGDLARFAREGAHVSFAFSRESRASLEVRGSRVQDHVLRDLASGALPAGSALFSVGPPEMADDLRARAPQLDVYTNV